MTASIIPFPRRGEALPLRPALNLPAPFTGVWQSEHLPLVDAAMTMLQADDAEFKRRCRSIAEAEGFTMLEHITAQLDRLAGQVGDVARSLAMVAKRMRSAMAMMQAAPA